jgi:GAF domain-containing protein
MLSMHWRTPHRPEERRLRVLDLYARQAADFIERVRNEEALAADLRDTRRLQELSARFVAEGDLQALCQEILGAAIALARADAGTVQLLDQATRELVLIGARGVLPEAQESSGSSQSTPLLTRSGRPIGVITTHWREHRRPTERELHFLDMLARQAADLIEVRQSRERLAGEAETTSSSR